MIPDRQYLQAIYDAFMSWRYGELSEDQMHRAIEDALRAWKS